MRYASHAWSQALQVCIQLTFSGDLLGGRTGGDWLAFTVNSHLYGPFLESSTQPAKTVASWCSSSPSNPDLMSNLLSGNTTFNFLMIEGSVHLQDVQITVTGVPAA